MLCAVLLCFSAQSQAIVNVEGLHLKKPNTGFSAKTSLGFSGADGNSQFFNVEWKTRFQYAQKKYTRFALFQYFYGESFHQQNLNKDFVHLRSIQHVTEKYSWEVFTQLQQNKFERLHLRALLGGGLRTYLIPRSPKRAVILGTGAFFSHESFINSSGTTDTGTRQLVRGNIYFVYDKKLSNDHVLFTTTYLQPAVTNLRDFRLLEQAGVNTNISKQLAIGLELSISHNNRPPQQVKKTDVLYKTSITYTF